MKLKLIVLAPTTIGCMFYTGCCDDVNRAKGTLTCERLTSKVDVKMRRRTTSIEVE